MFIGLAAFAAVWANYHIDTSNIRKNLKLGIKNDLKESEELCLKFLKNIDPNAINQSLVEGGPIIEKLQSQNTQILFFQNDSMLD